jgi:hypothetical protein
METEDGVCEFCGEFIPEDDRADHDAGRDAKRPECPHQDLEKIVLGERRRWVPGVAMPDAW